jgi:preprotein translocase subunit SecA
MYDVCESIITNYQDSRDYQGFQLEIIKEFAMECPISEAVFLKENPNVLTPMLFDKAQEHYKQKSKTIAEKTFSFISDVFFNNPDGRYTNVVIPFTDGFNNIQVISPLKKSYETHGKEVITSFEKSVSLSLIDDNWKEHLRELDELKTSVQNAVYEQKDPLLVYKFESFNLFKQLIERVNKDTTSFLFKGNLDGFASNDVREQQKPKKTDMSKLKTRRDDLSGITNPKIADQPIREQEALPPPPPPAPREKIMPAKAEHKVGRNDPCPCGSGKKYKNCHGKEN